MKRKILFSIVFLAFAYAGFSQKTVLSVSELPGEINTYVKSNFPQRSITQALKDNEVLSFSYELILDDFTKLEFNSKNEITEIESRTKLPDSVIPSKILLYMKTNYPNNFIKEWGLDDRKQQVKLDNGIELEFDMNGYFLRIDD